MAVEERAIEALLEETRVFVPSQEFVSNAVLNDPSIYERSLADPVAFWEEVAHELDWVQPWEDGLQWTALDARWFVGGKLNACYNCVDRHISTPRRNKAAIICHRILGLRPDWVGVTVFYKALTVIRVFKRDRLCDVCCAILLRRVPLEISQLWRILLLSPSFGTMREGTVVALGARAVSWEQIG